MRSESDILSPELCLQRISKSNFFSVKELQVIYYRPMHLVRIHFVYLHLLSLSRVTSFLAVPKKKFFNLVNNILAETIFIKV